MTRIKIIKNGYNVEDEDELSDFYFLNICNELQSGSSDVHVFDIEDLSNLKEMSEKMLAGEDNTASVFAGDPFTFVNGGKGVYTISFRITDSYFKGYYFSERDVRLLISSIRNIIEE